MSTYQKFKNLSATPSSPASAPPPYMMSPSSINLSTKWLFLSASPTSARPTQSLSPILSFSQTLISLLLHLLFFFSSFLIRHFFSQFTPILKLIHLELSIEDHEREAFRSKAIDVNVMGSDVIVVTNEEETLEELAKEDYQARTTLSLLGVIPSLVALLDSEDPTSHS
ncbi:Uncharacterized protein Fot_03531 [Forsythia ovata]|uniref:Uncharacterized protein n=1 Tax=Forsythia ovata TaxID=205694 RepID=A0ABD1X9Z5_9LAMI